MKPRGAIGEGAHPAERYRFGGVLVDATAHTITRDGQPHPVEPKAFAVLLVLLHHPGELVLRDDLLDAVWGHRHVTPGVLTRAIAQLRGALDDHAHEPRYIQTQHALGYRFIGELARGPGPGPELDPAPAPAPAPACLPEAVPTAESSLPADAGAAPIAAAVPPADTPHASPAGTRVGQPVLPVVPAAPAHTRRWRPAAAAGLLALIAVVGLTLWLARGPARSPPADASIAVLPFTSLSSERDDGYFAEGLAVEMHDALAGVPGLKVAARTVGAALEDEADVRALGRRLGVATVLDASVRREGARVRINARLSDTATGFTLWTDSYDREVADVFGLQSEIASEVVHALLGVLPDAHPGLARRLSPTSNIAAYDVYLKGLQRLQSASDEELAQAVVLFREALTADPAFARAQAGICRAEIRRFENARDATVFDRAQAACGRAAQMDPGLREVSLALGEMHRVRGEFAQATEQYTRALDDLALRPAAYIGLARTQGAQGRDALALDYFRRAMEQRPGDPTAHRELGYHHYLKGDLPRAIAAFRTATTLQPDDEQLWNSLGGLSLASGDSAGAAEAFERSLAIRPSYGALSNFGTLRYQQGRYAEAGALYRHAAELDPDDYRIWGNLGDALVADKATAGQAREPYSRAARLAQEYLRIRTDDAQAVALLGWYRANLGQRDAALALVARAEAIGTEPGEVALANAQTLALLGEEAAARTRLARALGADIPLSRVQASPQLRRWAARSAVLR